MQQAYGDLEQVRAGIARFEPGIKALILDDSVFDRRRIRRLSLDTSLGIALDEISSIDALQAVLDQERFDVILLDYKLPAGDGLEALKVIRDHPVNGGCPAIMMTGHDRSDLAVKSLKMGCVDYISKDQLTSETLRKSILSAIETVADGDGRGLIREQDFESLTSSVMSRYTNALQPKLASAIRDMRALRTRLRDRPDLAGDVEKVERQCIQMWAILLDPKVVSSGQEFRH